MGEITIKSIWATKINVLKAQLDPGEMLFITSEDAKTHEIKNLIRHKYVEIVK